MFENLGKIVEDAVTSATQAVDAAWPQVKEAVSSATEKAKGAAQSAAQAARESVLVGAVVPGKAALTPLPWRRTPIRPPLAGPSPGCGWSGSTSPVGNPPLGGRHHPGGGVCRPPLEGQRAHGAPGKRRQAAYPLEP